MRIIAGTARSLPLKTIEGKDTRPTTDKTKETLFNVMQFDVPGAYFLDLFAGSGQIGLEALSRGAAYAVFVENSRKAASCIEDNIHFTKFDKVSRLMMTDAVPALPVPCGTARRTVHSYLLLRQSSLHIRPEDLPRHSDRRYSCCNVP